MASGGGPIYGRSDKISGGIDAPPIRKSVIGIQSLTVLNSDWCKSISINFRISYIDRFPGFYDPGADFFRNDLTPSQYFEKPLVLGRGLFVAIQIK